ncbi:MAG: hypothetical protein ACR2MG_02080 [Pyrinomonadaceae bacterium]
MATRDFEPALRFLVGEKAPLSPSTISRLNKDFKTDYESWQKADFEQPRKSITFTPTEFICQPESQKKRRAWWSSSGLMSWVKSIFQACSKALLTHIFKYLLAKVLGFCCIYQGRAAINFLKTAEDCFNLRNNLGFCIFANISAVAMSKTSKPKICQLLRNLLVNF